MTNNFPSKLKGLRIDKNLTQQQVSEALQISRATLGHWEIGRSQPDLDELVKISNYFNCTLDYLIDPAIPKDHILYKNGIDKRIYKEIQKEVKEESKQEDKEK